VAEAVTHETPVEDLDGGGGTRMKRNWRKPVVAVMALSLVAAACGGDDDDDAAADEDTAAEDADTGGDDADTGGEDADTGGDDADTGGEGGSADLAGAEVTITGPERDDPSVAALNEVLGAFAEENGFELTYTGDADWETNINTQVQGGNPPSISIFPQPGKLKDFAEQGFIVPLTDDVNATVDEYWDESYQSDGQGRDGEQYGVPVKTDVKSLVWYKPARFEEAGLTVPESFDEFTQLLDDIKALDDGAPLCVGIESGTATGWPFTDWVEEMVLRLHGPDVYDQWVNHEIPFNDPQIVEAMQAVVDIWNGEGNVYASGGSIAGTNFADNTEPLVNDQCWMHRQANFLAGLFPEGTDFANPDNPDAVDVFYFPDINGDRPLLIAGTLAAGFNDDPATMAVLDFMATAEYAEQRQSVQTEAVGGGLSGFLSGAEGIDPSVFQPLEQSFLEIIAGAEVARFDGSDLMPADVGAGTFWSEGTSLVNGQVTAEEAADAIEASWPS
jgi:alpha-glucoside transport system substrate-binding protein